MYTEGVGGGDEDLKSFSSGNKESFGVEEYKMADLNPNTGRNSAQRVNNTAIVTLDLLVKKCLLFKLLRAVIRLI